MSASNSGTSTPRGGDTPPPGSDGPSPLTVGAHFVKQYYKVLSTNPDQMHRFYQPDSFLSHGVGSEPTKPVVFDKDHADDLKDRFYLANGVAGGDCPIRFEFENGAIDAQLSVNGGVLLVVTGHIVYLNSEDEDEEVEDGRRKAFVHTFFLGSLSAGGKRSYYVHNDVLRFLGQHTEASFVEEEAEPVETELVLDEEATEPEVKPTPEPVPEVIAASEPEVEEPIHEAPGGGVEESKEPLLDDEVVLGNHEAAETKPELDEEEAPTKEEKKVDVGLVESKSSKPMSWASLAARSGVVATSNPSTPVRPTKAAPNKAKTSPLPVAQTAPAVANSATAVPSVAVAPVPSDAGPGQKHTSLRGKRDPEFTLVIKNLAEGTTEADVLGLFESFAATNDSKIVSATVPPNRGIAFIDFDSAAPVLAIAEEHAKSPFQINERVLEVYQKALEQRGRRGGASGGRGSYRGGPSNGSAPRGGGVGGAGGSGGRQQYRRGAGRGDRAVGRGRMDRGGR